MSKEPLIQYEKKEGNHNQDLIKTEQDQEYSQETDVKNEDFGLKLYHNLVEINKNLEEKEQGIILIKQQLHTLDNNINAQVDEFLKSMFATDMNFENILLESQKGSKVDHLIDSL